MLKVTNKIKQAIPVMVSFEKLLKGKRTNVQKTVHLMPGDFEKSTSMTPVMKRLRAKKIVSVEDWTEEDEKRERKAQAEAKSKKAAIAAKNRKAAAEAKRREALKPTPAPSPKVNPVIDKRKDDSSKSKNSDNK